jgi:hypothetical protein
MRKIKIGLTIIAISIISFIAWQSYMDTPPPPPPPPPPKNQLIKGIEHDIDSVKTLPESRFCDVFFREINARIENWHAEGRLGDNPSDNDQWKENLSRDLYTVYADKFTNQTLYVFRGHEWAINYLNFIRLESRTLIASKRLAPGPVREKFGEIQTVFNKYDEIVGFVSSCKNFYYSAPDDILAVKSKISRTEAYRNNHLENEYVNNCTRLHNQLNEVPQALFEAHVRYLDSQIKNSLGKYSEYESQGEYVAKFHKPFLDEIKALDNEIYKVDNFNSEYRRLTNKWNNELEVSFDHIYSKREK